MIFCQKPFANLFKLIVVNAILSSTLFLIIAAPYRAKAQTIEGDILNEIHKIIKWEASVDANDTPGFIIGIIEPDTTFIVWNGSSANRNGQIERDASFALGGLSKVYIAFLYQELVKANIIDDEIELKQMLPSLQNSPWGSINLYHLLTHQSGIPRSLKNVNTDQGDPYEHIQAQDILDGLMATRPPRKVRFLYSHYNYAILTLAMEELTSRNIEELWSTCRKCVELRTTLDSNIDSLDLAPGLNKIGKIADRRAYGAMTYSIGLHGTINNLLEIVHIIANLDQSPQNLTSERNTTKVDKSIKFSRGLYVLEGNRNYTIFSHSGRTNQHSAAFHYVPETETGVVIISNSEIGTKDLSLLVLRMVNENWKRKRINTNE